MKYGSAENAKLRDVCEFSDTYVHEAEKAGVRRGEQPVQDGDDNAGGLTVAEEVSRKGGNENGDDNRW